ncbi:hypothetical protein [Polaromonas sp.]|uniref:hypothetical protein n=1 Tax=Polaromonas sp. TaxID=1869339 RepID=UPI00286CCC8F|nr:hypothetical protein [Polaromonas sp.]
MNDSIPDLKIEMMDDGQGDGLIMLTQDGSGNVDRVAVHPLHLRYMAEKMGLMESNDPQAAKTIATLQRRMALLRDRIDNLHNYLVNHSDHKHADLSYEVTYATACIDLADEFCADFPSPVSPSALDADKEPTPSGQGTDVTGSPSASAQLAMEL